jgi:NAD(P)H dehydrogenase (quinone)
VLVGAGHDGACYDITGPHAYAAADLAALYGELGGRTVSERAVSDAELIAGIVGTAAGDNHLRYGAELVASFGRSIREGYMSACTDQVARLAGGRARSLTSGARAVAQTQLRRSASAKGHRARVAG